MRSKCRDIGYKQMASRDEERIEDLPVRANSDVEANSFHTEGFDGSDKITQRQASDIRFSIEHCTFTVSQTSCNSGYALQ